VTLIGFKGSGDPEFGTLYLGLNILIVFSRFKEFFGNAILNVIEKINKTFLFFKRNLLDI